MDPRASFLSGVLGWTRARLAKFTSRLIQELNGAASLLARRLEKIFPAGSDAQKAFFSKLGISGVGSKTGTALSTMFASQSPAIVFGNMKRVVAEIALIGGVSEAVDLLQDFIKSMGNEITPDVLEYINEITTDIQTMQQVTKDLGAVGDVISGLAGNKEGLVLKTDVAEPVDAVAWVKAQKAIADVAQNQARRDLDVDALTVRDRIIELEELSVLLGLTPRKTLRCLELMRKVDGSYEALLDNGFLS